MRKSLFSAIVAGFAGILVCLSGPAWSQTVTSFSTQADGALCALSNGGSLKVQVCAPKIIRIVYTQGTTIPSPQGLVVGRSTFTPGTFSVADNGTSIVVTTPECSTLVNKANSLVSFKNPAGTTICSETARGLYPVTRSGFAGDSGTLNFNSPTGEGVYGLGNLSMGSPAWGSGGGSWWEANPPDRTGQINGRSFTFDMHQANWYDVIPFFMTTRGYGILMNFCCHATKSSPLNFTASCLLNNCWDYFFFYGPQFDTIIAGYRNVTGPAPMLPKWAFGFWQCKNRYASSTELNTAVTTFRSQNLPLDCIVQDWNWWTAYGDFAWNSSFTSPAPSSWISTIHGNNCHFALSIWPTFVSSSSHYSAMSSHLITTSCNSGTAGNWANVFDTVALNLFWGYMNTGCFSAGVDAWWCDATEPECPQLTNQATSWGPIEMFSNAYSLSHAKSIYEHQRAISSSKRVVNLTRSFYGGQHRFGTIYWNGDISSSSMTNVATTVSGGINSSMAGNPYWCSDIGGFQTNGGSLTDDILSRWFEAGTFFPIFRIHGSRSTEIYNMSSAVQPIAKAYDNMRYHMMPYIYSLAWKVTNEGYTMTRALWFDFPGDSNVIGVANQYMFGPALMICPVTTTNATSRNVYLPAGTWYNFWTGASSVYATGTTVSNVSAPQSIIPIFARAGAILPLGPRIQYATQSVDPIELRVYPGADGNFTLYEDEGDNYNYESGTYSTIPISYSNTTGRVTIGTRQGSFPGMLANRTFNIVFVTSGHGIADTVTPNPDCVIAYHGTAVTGCPVGVCKECEERRVAHHIGTICAMKTADERIVFPAEYRGLDKEVSVFSLAGRLLTKAVFSKQSISLRKDLRIPTGAYIVKIREVSSSK